MSGFELLNCSYFFEKETLDGILKGDLGNNPRNGNIYIWSYKKRIEGAYMITDEKKGWLGDFSRKLEVIKLIY